MIVVPPSALHLLNLKRCLVAGGKWATTTTIAATDSGVNIGARDSAIHAPVAINGELLPLSG